MTEVGVLKMKVRTIFKNSNEIMYTAYNLQSLLSKFSIQFIWVGRKEKHSRNSTAEKNIGKDKF